MIFFVKRQLRNDGDNSVVVTVASTMERCDSGRDATYFIAPNESKGQH